MRKQMCLVGIFSLFLLGLASCSQDETAPQDPKGRGDVKINFLGFDQTSKSRTVGNIKRPATNWSKSVKDLMILFVKDDKVLDARSIPLPMGNDMAQKSVTINQIPAMTGGDIYIIANSGQNQGVLRKNDAGGTWSAETAKNQLFSKLYMNLLTAEATTPEELLGETKYKQPAEIFLAHQANVTIQKDKVNDIATPLTLGRIISLIRVRLNPIGMNKDNCNFTDSAKVFVYIRKTNPKLYANGTTWNGHTTTTGIFLPKKFNKAEPATDLGYAGSDPILGGDCSAWQDILSFPGGSTSTSADKFEVVIKGIAKAGYIYPNGTAATPGAPVYFSGPVDYEAKPNGITILNVTVQSQGVPTPPAPGQEFGDLTIKVNIEEWGSVTTGNITV